MRWPTEPSNNGNDWSSVDVMSSSREVLRVLASEKLPFLQCRDFSQLSPSGPSARTRVVAVLSCLSNLPPNGWRVRIILATAGYNITGVELIGRVTALETALKTLAAKLQSLLCRSG